MRIRLVLLLSLLHTVVSLPACTIDSVSPSEIQTGSELVITGSLVGTTNVQVDIGYNRECTVTLSTDSEIRCIVGIAIAGSSINPRIVYPEDEIECTSSSTVQVPLDVTSLSTNATGILGGATLVLTGQGFGQGDDSQHYVYVDGNGLCESLQPEDTTLTCITRAGSYGPNEVWLAIAGVQHITYDFPFAASEEYQPTIRNVFSKPVEDKDGKSSTLVHITGGNLDGPGHAEIGTIDCVYVSSTPKQHICRIENGIEFPPGPLPIEVTTRNRGRAEGSLDLTMKCDNRKRCCPSGSSCVVPQGMDFGSQKQCVKLAIGRLNSPDVVVPPIGCGSQPTPICPCAGNTQEPVRCKNGVVYDSQCLATCAGQKRCKPL